MTKYQESFRNELARYYDCITSYEEWMLDPAIMDLTGYFIDGINGELMVETCVLFLKRGFLCKAP